MQEIQQEFDKIFSDLAIFFEHQQEVYGNEIYSSYNIDEIFLTPLEIKEKRLSILNRQIKN